MSADQVRVSVAIAVPPAEAFELFTTHIDQWWRRGPSFRVAGTRAGLIRIEPQLGGRLFESIDAPEGERVFEIGRVQVWQPPTQLAFSWRNSNFSDGQITQVEVLFAPQRSGTLVTVTHRGWDSLRADHPSRHGLDEAAFSRMMGLWWGDQMTALRLRSVSRG